MDFLLSVGIPCYNSAAYMDHAIESVLAGGEEIEIIIVDDGSTKDDTLAIAKGYEERYPGRVRAIHQENGGHGAAVTTALYAAKGHFFKVVDSDDWVDEAALVKTLDVLREVVNGQKELDLMIVNYVYENEARHKSSVMHYRGAMPEGRFFVWKDLGYFKQSQQILMHSVIYRTKLLTDMGFKLPEHTFYVDNIFVYEPLPAVKTLYYLDVDFYGYYIGREDQSVNEKVMIGRVDQQIFITKHMIGAVDLSKLTEKKLAKYMVHYLAMMMSISTVLLLREGSKESLAKCKELWEHLQKESPWSYAAIRKSFLGLSGRLSGFWLGRKCILGIYKISRRIFGFN